MKRKLNGAFAWIGACSAVVLMLVPLAHGSNDGGFNALVVPTATAEPTAEPTTEPTAEPTATEVCAMPTPESTAIAE